MSVRPASLAAMLFAVLALLVAACGDDETEGSSGATPQTTQEAQSEEPAGEEEGEEGESEEEREREEREAEEAGGKACSEVGDLDGKAKNRPPSDVTILDGADLYESEGPFGKTERFFAAVDGEPADLEARRDAAVDALERSGYKLLSKDQEEATEAEAHMSGKHTVDIQVINLCEGKLRIRYTVS